MEPDSTPAPFLFGRAFYSAVAWRVVRRSATAGAVVPDIISVAWAAVCGALGRLSYQTGTIARARAARRIGALVKTYAHHH